jgi:hypothetical protein
MSATPISIELTKCKAGRGEDGIFTADVEWTLTVSISPNVVDMLADRVAYLFRDQLPLVGTVYPGVPFATCRNVSCDMEEVGVYKFAAQFSDKNSKETAATNEDPTKDLPIIKPVASTRELAISKDRDNKGILNKAGDPVIQTRDQQFVGLTVRVNVADIPAAVLDLVDTTNAAPFKIGGWHINTNQARFILPSDFMSEPKSRNEISYYEFGYEMAIDTIDMHYGTPMNAGFRQLVPEDPEADPIVYRKERILEEDASEPGEPVPLDEFGVAIVNPTPDDVTFLKVKKYREADYSWLPGVEPWPDAPEIDL